MLSSAAFKTLFSFQLSSVNLTDLMKLSRALIREAANFTNKELFLNYLSRFFKTGASLINPINQSNDMVALDFSQVRIPYYLISIRKACFERKIELKVMKRTALNSRRDSNLKFEPLLVSQSARQSVSRSVSQSVIQLVGRLISQSVSQSVGQSVGRSVSKSVSQSVGRSVARSVSR